MASPTLDRLDRLLDHLEWANLRALEATREAGNPEALRLLSHLLGAERVWLARIERGESSDLEIWPELGFAECAELMERNVVDLRRLLESTPGAELERRVTYRNLREEEFHTPLGEILLHLFLHGSYHRGQIAMRMRDAGHEPVNTDFITFVRERPERDS